MHNRYAMPLASHACHGQHVGGQRQPLHILQRRFANLGHETLGKDRAKSATPVRLEFTLDTGHIPFLTDVLGLVPAIEKSADYGFAR
jgi:hypothetical protein